MRWTRYYAKNNTTASLTTNLGINPSCSSCLGPWQFFHVRQWWWWSNLTNAQWYLLQVCTACECLSAQVHVGKSAARLANECYIEIWQRALRCRARKTSYKMHQPLKDSRFPSTCPIRCRRWMAILKGRRRKSTYEIHTPLQPASTSYCTRQMAASHTQTYTNTKTNTLY